MKQNEHLEGDAKSPEDILSFEVLLNHVSEENKHSVKYLTIEACIKDSPLYSCARDGLVAFIENEGQEALDDLLANEFKENFYELMLQIVDRGLIDY